MTNLFFNDLLQKAETRIAPAKPSARFLLDKNEQPDDVDLTLKTQIVNRLLNVNWNRYPSACNKDIEAQVANYCDLAPENIVLGAGSASIITTLLDYFALNNKRIIITQPTYSLFDYHCKTYGIEYQPWLLTPELEYDYDNLPELGDNSVLVITSPNNPVGNSFAMEKLEEMLTNNPKSLILLDAVYAEFCEMDIAPLVRKYENLVVLRSFSKAFPIAGLRLGYLCACPQVAAVVRKLMLPFTINPLALIFAREILFSAEFMENSRRQVQALIEERERMFRLLDREFSRRDLKVFNSDGNFLLVRIFDDASFARVLADLERNGIKVLNTSPFPLLQNTFRLSIGNRHENDALLQCLRGTLKPASQHQEVWVQWVREHHLMKMPLVANN